MYTAIPANKSKNFRFFYMWNCPDPDLDRHQNEKWDPDQHNKIIVESVYAFHIQSYFRFPRQKLFSRTLSRIVG
jgi:hypothetical protein